MREEQQQSSIDEVSDLLNSCLSRIGTQLERFSEQQQAEGLEKLVERLDEETGRLETLLTCLGDFLDKPMLSSGELEQLVRRTADDVLSTVDSPVVLRTDTPEHLPDLRMDVAILQAALHRAMVLGTAHAAPGGELIVRTRSGPGSMVFELSAIPGSLPVSTSRIDRGATLEKFLEELGGRCSSTVDDQHVLHLVLEFDTALSQA